MRDKYWSMFTDIKFKFFCYWKYRDISQKIVFWLKTVSTFTTSAGVICLLLQDKLPYVWTALIAVSQTYQAVQHLLPFEERITRINFFMPPLDKLINKIEREWEYIENYTDEQTIELIYTFKEQYSSLEEQYLSSFPFPHKKQCKDHATKELNNYCQYTYLSQGDEQ